MQSVELYQQERYEEAEICAKKELVLNARNHNSLQVVGNVCFIRGDFYGALAFYRRALCCGGNKADLFNVANTLFQLKKYHQSLLWVQKILMVDEAYFEALLLRGQCFLALEKTTDSISCFRQALQYNNKNCWLFNYLGQALQKNGNYEDALEASLQAVRLSGGEDSQHINFAYAVYEIALEIGGDSIRKFIDKWYSEYAENPIVKYAVAAIDSNREIVKSDLSYVQKMFDIFADDFEETLQGLDYQVPALIAEECLSIYRKKKLTNPVILDMGCGTGFCGKFLDSLSLEMDLEGVDISSEMLKKAAEKDVYKSLVCNDIERFFSKTDSLYQIIIAADVLTYFGSLENIFFQVKKHLQKNGTFIFSITQNTTGKDDYFLHMSGRFSHAENYIKKLIVENDFILKKQRNCKLRNEGNSSVLGWIFSIEKSS